MGVSAGPVSPYGLSHSSSYHSGVVIEGAAIAHTAAPVAVDAMPAAVAKNNDNRARVVVRLPADAKLYADGHLTNLTSEERSFVTPSLDADRDYQYTMRVEYTREGQTVSDSKKVMVRAGKTSTIDFVDTSRLASKKSGDEKIASTVVVNMPAAGKLFVGEHATEAQAGSQEFRTPELVKGQEYAYEFRAEVVVNGKTETQKQRVTFKGGDTVKVNFVEGTTERLVSK